MTIKDKVLQELATNDILNKEEYELSSRGFSESSIRGFKVGYLEGVIKSEELTEKLVRKELYTAEQVLLNDGIAYGKKIEKKRITDGMNAALDGKDAGFGLDNGEHDLFMGILDKAYGQGALDERNRIIRLIDELLKSDKAQYGYADQQIGFQTALEDLKSKLESTSKKEALQPSLAKNETKCSGIVDTPTDKELSATSDEMGSDNNKPATGWCKDCGRIVEMSEEGMKNHKCRGD